MGCYHDVGVVRGHLDLLLPLPRADGRPFPRLPWVVLLQPHVIGLLHVQDWWAIGDAGPGERGFSRYSVPRPLWDPCCWAARSTGDPERAQPGAAGVGPGWPSEAQQVRLGLPTRGVSGSAPPCPLTLVLLHERPHVPLLRAVREGAVPHVLALAAVLRMDAELQGRHGETLLSPVGLCHCPASGQALLGPHGPISEVPLPPCIPPRRSHRIAVGSCEWTAVASPTPTSSWPWTSPGGPAAPWSSCRIERAV